MGYFQRYWRRKLVKKGFWRQYLFFHDDINGTKDKIPVVIGTIFWICLLSMICIFVLKMSHSSITDSGDIHVRRHILSVGSGSELIYTYTGNGSTCSMINKTTEGFNLEGCQYETTRTPGAWIFLYLFLTLICFIAIAIICDDFFVPSLEVISEKLNLSEDVAGATFMAAGSSAPELFSSIAAVTFDSDVGIGTIVGSAVFNLLVIIALTAALTKKILNIDWRPLTRDSIFYLVSIIWFIFSVWDTLIHVYDAVVMLLIYIVYIIWMVFNSRVMEQCDNCCKKCSCTFFSQVEPEDDDEMGADEEAMARETNKRQAVNENGTLKNPRQSQTYQHDRRNSMMHQIALSSEKRKSLGNANSTGLAAVTEESDEDDKFTIACCTCCSFCPPIRGAPPSREDYKDNLEKAEGCCNKSNITCLYGFKWIIFVLAFPFIVLFSYTIPDCTKDKNKKYFILSFIMSVFWIMAISFGMVTVVARTGCLIGINNFVMSLVVLAAGTSIPDLLSSIIVAREGYGDMAVSNAIGSNVFDINLGLGLPFLIRILINKGNPINLMSSTERKSWCLQTMVLMPHPKFGFILIGLLLLAYTIFMIARFRLNRVIGISFFIIYIVFLTYAFVQHFICNLNGKYNC